jgi:hypothetical protein
MRNDWHTASSDSTVTRAEAADEGGGKGALSRSGTRQYGHVTLMADESVFGVRVSMFSVKLHLSVQVVGP